MAIVELRLKTWIPAPRVLFSETASGVQTWFHGDGRSESFDSMNYRTHQRFRIDTGVADYYVNATKGIGETEKVVINSNTGEVLSRQTDTASSSGLQYTKRVVDDILYLDCTCDCANPFVPYAPAINYSFTLKLTRSGHVRIYGSHDGFPGYEFWRKIGDGSAELIWSHDPRDTGETIASLAPPMEHNINTGKGA